MNPFYGKRVVLAGLFSSGFRKELRAKLHNLGAEVTNVVNKSVDLLIYGAEPGRRLAEANYLNIQTMSEEDFLLAYTKLNVNRLADHRVQHYSQLPSNPGGAIFMYEVRQMARELEHLRAFVQQLPLKTTGDGSYALDTDRAFVAPSDKALPIEIMIHGLVYRQDPIALPSSAATRPVRAWNLPDKLTETIFDELVEVYDTLNHERLSGYLHVYLFLSDDTAMFSIVTPTMGTKNVTFFIGESRPASPFDDIRYLANASDELQDVVAIAVRAREKGISSEVEYCHTTKAPVPSHGDLQSGIYVSRDTPVKVSNCTVNNGDQEDAERWRALLASPAIRILGSSNVKEGSDHGYAHFGMEIWSIHGSRLSGSESTAYGRDILTKYADVMRRNLLKTAAIDVTLTDNDNPAFNPITFTLRGENTSISLNFVEGDAILGAEGDAQKAMLLSSAKERGIIENVELVVERAEDKRLAVWSRLELKALSFEFEPLLVIGPDHQAMITDVYRKDDTLYFTIQKQVKGGRSGILTNWVEPIQTYLVKNIFSPFWAATLAERLGFTL